MQAIQDTESQEPKVEPGRNAPCSCGSGIRYKSCCGLLDPKPAETKEYNSVAKTFERAQKAQANGDYASARDGLHEVIDQVPTHVPALGLLARFCKAQGETAALEALARRLLKFNSYDGWAACELAGLLYGRKALDEAEKYARSAVRLDPKNAQAHNVFGMILTERNRLLAAEHHYRKALELHQPVGKLCANLALNLKRQGKLDEARAFYQQAMELEPDNVDSLLGWSDLEEVARNIKRAFELLDQVLEKHPGHTGAIMHRAKLLRRQKQYDQAIALLDELEQGVQQSDKGMGAGYYLNRAEILDRCGHYDKAFDAFDLANRQVRKQPERQYKKQLADNTAARLKRFITTERCRQLPRANKAPAGVATPLFIVGFPRSGTTMIEQVLSALPDIAAGDELALTLELTHIAPRMLKSDLSYPECLADLWLGDNLGALDLLRDFYLQKAALMGICKNGEQRFTDKMPLNETHLGLIGLLFPSSPIVHMIRHPLDVVLSTFFNDLTHGYNCSYSLESAAYHYALIRDLVDHYLANMELNYLAVKYEDFVTDPEPTAKKLLSFLGEPWDPSCLEFHKNPRYARTASYAQVTEKIYDRSMFRYRNYRKQIDQIIPILQPAIERLGYDIKD